MSKTRQGQPNSQLPFPGRISDEVYDRAIERVRKMTPAQRRRSLIDAGILTSDGKLTPMYRPS
ncbi:MAG: hypothetical protein HYY24_16835 [Verrucomicrobia bacterium]|nr:hypothetical protein [Verrucomicrobiota bacterium]